MTRQFQEPQASRSSTFVLALLGVFSLAVYLAVTIHNIWVTVVAVAAGLLLLPYLFEVWLIIYLLIALLSAELNIRTARKTVTKAQILILENRKLRWSIKGYLPYACLPIGRANPYALSLANSLIVFANKQCSRHFAPLMVRELSAGAISMYREALAILQVNALTEPADLVIAQTLLACQLEYAGLREEGVKQQRLALESAAKIKDTDASVAAPAMVLLAHGLLVNDLADDDVAREIGEKALRWVEQSKVGPSAAVKMKLLTQALENLSLIYAKQGRDDDAATVMKRKAILDAAVIRDKLVVVEL